MAAPAEDDTITLVTTDDPPVELAVERDKLLDSSVFSDMLSLPKTGDCKARVDVAETAADLEAWIEFLRSGKVEMPDNAGEESLGRKAVTIAKLVDKYGCTISRHLLIAELWHVTFASCSSNRLQADHGRAGAFSPSDGLIRSLSCSQATPSKRIMSNDTRQRKYSHYALRARRIGRASRRRGYHSASCPI
jgi:hypothetical protein